MSVVEDELGTESLAAAERTVETASEMPPLTEPTPAVPVEDEVVFAGDAEEVVVGKVRWRFTRDGVDVPVVEVEYLLEKGASKRGFGLLKKR